MALSPSKGGSLFQAAIDEQVARLEAGDEILDPSAMAAELADAYFEYSKDADLPGADMTAGGTVSILEAAFTVGDDTSVMASQIATGLGNYWSTCGVPGLPAHGGSSVLSVVVLGAAQIPAFLTAIQNSITDQEIQDPFAVFFQTLETVVNTIVCTITEDISGTPTPFPEFIS